MKENEIEMKQVLLIRTNFGKNVKGKIITMKKGKMITQGAHASVLAILDILHLRGSISAIMCYPERVGILSCWFDTWLESGYKKVSLRVSKEEDLLRYYDKAKEAGLPCSKVIDQGLTQIPPNSLTVVAIGPAPSELIDKITGGLKLI